MWGKKKKLSKDINKTKKQINKHNKNNKIESEEEVQKMFCPKQILKYLSSAVLWKS